MADKSNDGSYQPRKSKKERVWTNFEKLLLSDEFKEKNEREKSKILDKAAA